VTVPVAAAGATFAVKVRLVPVVVELVEEDTVVVVAVFEPAVTVMLTALDVLVA
jgi:hypothetical protein